MLFIHYPKCSTCKKAKNYLDENNLKYEERDIKENNPTSEELLNWSTKFDIPLNKFFNTSGLIYRELNLKEKLPSLSDKEKLDLLSRNGMLVKRPLLITDNNIIIGFKEKEYALLKK